MEIYCFTEAKKLNEQTHYIILSVAISYIFNVMLGTQSTIMDLKQLTVSIIMAIIGGLVLPLVVHSEGMKILYSHFSRRGLDGNVINETFDMELGCNVAVYIKNGGFVHTGTLFNYDDDREDPYIALIAYTTYRIDSDGCYVEMHGFDHKYKSLVIKLSEVERMEVFYEDETNMIPYKYKELIDVYNKDIKPAHIILSAEH